MARPKQYGHLFDTIVDLHSQGLGVTAITHRLEQTELEPPDPRTVRRYLDEFKKLSTRERLLHAPFEWCRLDDYRLPWESSEFLNNFVRRWKSGQLFFHLPAWHQVITPPARHVIWAWRVHCALPELDVRDVWFFSFLYSVRQLVNNVYHVDTDMRDLDLAVQLRPWESTEQAAVYRRELGQEPINPSTTEIIGRAETIFGSNSSSAGVYSRAGLPNAVFDFLLRKGLIILPSALLDEIQAAIGETEEKQ